MTSTDFRGEAASPAAPSPAAVADAVGRQLAALGVDTVFRVIGSGNPW